MKLILLTNKPYQDFRMGCLYISKFDETSTNIVFDSSPNGINGTL